jgi:hypothetical protein
MRLGSTRHQSAAEEKERYEKHVSSLDPLVQVLLVKNMPREAMVRLARQSEINLRTLEGWRLSVKKHPSWRRYRCPNRRRVFDDREDNDLATHLRVQIREERYVAPVMMNLLAEHLKRLLEAGAEIRPNWGDEILNSREIPVPNTDIP